MSVSGKGARVGQERVGPGFGSLRAWDCGEGQGLRLRLMVGKGAGVEIGQGLGQRRGWEEARAGRAGAGAPRASAQRTRAKRKSQRPNPPRSRWKKIQRTWTKLPWRPFGDPEHPGVSQRSRGVRGFPGVPRGSRGDDLEGLWSEVCGVLETFKTLPNDTQSSNKQSFIREIN